MCRKKHESARKLWFSRDIFTVNATLVLTPGCIARSSTFSFMTLCSRSPSCAAEKAFPSRLAASYPSRSMRTVCSECVTRSSHSRNSCRASLPPGESRAVVWGENAGSLHRRARSPHTLLRVHDFVWRSSGRLCQHARQLEVVCSPAFYSVRCRRIF